MGLWDSPTTKDAYRLSLASVIITFFAFLFGIVLFNKTGSSLILVYGFENAVDFISSVVVLWRFFAPSSVDDVIEKKLQAREERASIAISFVMILLGLFIIIASLRDFARGQEDDEGNSGKIIALSFFSFIIFGALCAFKFQYAAKLDSESLYKDGICSLIGTIMSSALMINTIMIRNNPEIWFIDPTIALFAGLGAITLGTHAVYVASVRQGIPIFSSAWWNEDGLAPGASKTDSNVKQAEMTTKKGKDGENDLV